MGFVTDVALKTVPVCQSSSSTTFGSVSALAILATAMHASSMYVRSHRSIHTAVDKIQLEAFSALLHILHLFGTNAECRRRKWDSG